MALVKTANKTRKWNKRIASMEKTNPVLAKRMKDKLNSIEKKK